MELKEGKEQFIQAWGTLGSNWGINRTMAQIHALLLISPEPLSAKDIEKALKVSMGNVNMNIRALINWGLVYKKSKSGERKDFYVAEKEVWEIVRKIIIQRKKKELDPVIKLLNGVSTVEGNTKEVKEFEKVLKEIQLFAHKADVTLDNLVKAEHSWVMGTFLKMIK